MEADKTCGSGDINAATSAKLRISDFCDMDRFTQMMKDWAQSTGLATMAVGSDGEYISGCYNFTDLCLKFIRNSPEGMRRCVECDRKGSGIYFCHAGLVDFAVPITLEDGTMLGTVLGGQVLPERPDEERFRAGARDLGLDEDAYIDALRRVNIRTSEEIKASADLLSNVINMFVRTSYAARENAASLSERAEIISSLGSIYFSDYYIDLDKDQMLELDATDELRAFVDCRLGASRLLDSLCRYLAVPDHFAEFLEFTDLSTLRSRLGSRQSIAHDFICRDSGWCRAVFITANRGEGGRVSHVIFALQHIQEEKEKELRVQQALRDSADRANRANKAKSDFLSRMSHDIRTPINGIIGMAYLAGREDNPPKTKDCLAKIDSSSKFLLGLINDILDMTKAESDKIELHPEPYPPQEFHEYLDAVFMPLFRDKRQKFLLDSHPVKGRVPVMDKLHINQVVFNLLSNAVKYTPEGGTITYRALFRQISDSGRLHMRVKVIDNGIGIGPEFQRVLFDPFTQEGRSDTSDNRGSGLGLSIAKRLVDLMGGTISVESAPGKGTTFTLDMEVDSVPESSSASSAPAGSASSDALRGAHILLCEDHPLNQQIVRELLESKGALVEVAENGQLGVERFRRSSVRFYSAILMDIRMPVMDGYSAAAAMRALERPDAGKVPIIAMTADAFEDDVRRCMDAGMNAHIAKPIEPERLFECLLDWIGREKGAAQ